MMFSRGTHHTSETEALPSASDAENSDATPPIWWVKTIASWTLLLVAVGVLAVLVVVPRLTGSTAYTVLTGSMQPTYPPGTLIVVKPTPGDQLKAGDVITFQPESGNPSVTTHRIISIVYDASGKRRFITKGDANNATDPVQLVEEQVRGRLLYSVPYLGRINSLISGSSRSIAVFVIAGGLGAYALWMWISSIRDRKKPKPPENPEPGAAPPDPPMPPAPTQAVPAHAEVGGRHSAGSENRCYACGADQSGRPPLAYSAVPDPPSAAPVIPSAEITQPIPFIK